MDPLFESSTQTSLGSSPINPKIDSSEIAKTLHEQTANIILEVTSDASITSEPQPIDEQVDTDNKVIVYIITPHFFMLRIKGRIC